MDYSRVSFRIVSIEEFLLVQVLQLLILTWHLFVSDNYLLLFFSNNDKDFLKLMNNNTKY